MKNLEQLFVEQLKDVYSAEKQLTKALPRMARAATSPTLRKAFEDHLAVTRGQIERLDTVFEQVGARAGRKTCAAMQGLIAEGEELIAAEPPKPVLDAGLIAAAQRVEHYEIAAYGTLRSYAALLGHKAAVKLLEKTLKEESDTDQRLNALAEGGVNRDAISPPAEARKNDESLIGKAVRAVAEATGLAEPEMPPAPKRRTRPVKKAAVSRKKGG